MLLDGRTPPAYRPVRLSGEPSLALVVVCGGEGERLAALLRSLAGDCAQRGVELAVAAPCAADDAHRWERAFPGVRFIWQGAASAADLRAGALALVDGDIVLFATEEEVAGAGWLETRLAGWPGASRRTRGRQRSRSSLPRRTGSAAPVVNHKNGLV